MAKETWNVDLMLVNSRLILVSTCRMESQFEKKELGARKNSAALSDAL